MCKYLFTISILILFTTHATSQVTSQITALNRFNITRNDTVYTFYAKKPANPISPDKSKNYYWYSGDTVLITREGYDGRLLDGVYKVNYPNKNLREQGSFTNGLKDGEWKFWKPNGELYLVEKWNKGLLRVDKVKKKKPKKVEKIKKNG